MASVAFEGFPWSLRWNETSSNQDGGSVGSKLRHQSITQNKSVYGLSPRNTIVFMAKSINQRQILNQYVLSPSNFL